MEMKKENLFESYCYPGMHTSADFEADNLSKYIKLDLMRKNLETTGREYEYVDPFDGNRIKDIRGNNKSNDSVEGFIVTYEKFLDAMNSRQSAKAETAPVSEHFHRIFTDKVIQPVDSYGMYHDNASSGFEADNLMKYDSLNLRQKNNMISYHETEYVDPDTGAVMDIRNYRF